MTSTMAVRSNEVQWITSTNGITVRQANYILALVRDREIDESAAEQINARVHAGTVTKGLASEWIKRLKDKPYLNRNGTATGEWRPVDVNTFAQMGQPSAPGEELFAMCKVGNHPTDEIVPRGSYALRTTNKNATNEIAFYSVWIASEPDADGDIRWSVKMYRSDERCKIQRSAQYMVLNRIAQDPLAAATLYGLEKKRCGICGRKLTKDESRERGIGPVCAEKWGW